MVSLRKESQVQTMQQRAAPALQPPNQTASLQIVRKQQTPARI